MPRRHHPEEFRVFLRDVRSVNDQVFVRAAAAEAVSRQVTEDSSDKAHASKTKTSVNSVPLFPLLPSVQMLFAPFCLFRSHVREKLGEAMGVFVIGRFKHRCRSFVAENHA